MKFQRNKHTNERGSEKNYSRARAKKMTRSAKQYFHDIYSLFSDEE
jgi:hypothetical protein